MVNVCLQKGPACNVLHYDSLLAAAVRDEPVHIIMGNGAGAIEQRGGKETGSEGAQGMQNSVSLHTLFIVGFFRKKSWDLCQSSGATPV